jgi:hypothetical protein
MASLGFVSRSFLAFALLLAPATARPDASVTDAASERRALPLGKLDGPYPTLEAACASTLGDDKASTCEVTHRVPSAAILLARFPGGQIFGSLVVHASSGWFFVGDRAPFLMDTHRGRGTFAILELSERAPGIVLRAIESHWYKPSFEELERAPANEDDLYYCFEMRVLCRLPRAGLPMCGAPLPVAGRLGCQLPDATELETSAGKALVAHARAGTRAAGRLSAERWDWRSVVTVSTDDRIDVSPPARWPRLPMSFEGWGEWMANVAAKARSLAGHYRLGPTS